MQFNPKTYLEENEIYLEKPEPSFGLANEMFQVVDKNRDHVLPWLEWGTTNKTKTPEDSFMFMVCADQKWKANKGFEYLIHLKETKEIIGGIGVFHTDSERSHKIEIGYWLAKPFCGKGYMQKAVRLIEKEFSALGAIRFVIRNDVENIPSVKTAEALGYHFEGIAKKDKWNNYLKSYRDMNIWSKTME